MSVPPSKSLLQRALALAVQGDGATEIVVGTGAGEDVARFAGALAALSGDAVPPGGHVRSGFAAGALGTSRDRVRADLGLNATGLRIATALAGSRPDGARTLLTGRPALLARPHRVLLRALTRLGAHAIRKPSGALRVIAGPWTRHDVAIPAGTSSQFATALLLAAPRRGGLALTLVGEIVSVGYLDATIEMLRAFGLAASREGALVSVGGGIPRAARFEVEADASSAAPWWAAAALSGGTVRVTGLSAASRQPDMALLGILARMGARVDIAAPTGAGGAGAVAGSVTVRGPDGRLRGAGEVDLRDAPDLAPLVAALAAGADGETRVVRAPHLRHKETDRIRSSVAAVVALGGDASASEDGFLVRGRTLRAGTVDAAGDHRLVLAFGALGLAVPGLEIVGARAAGKSYPGFLDALERAVGGGGRGESPAPGPPP